MHDRSCVVVDLFFGWLHHLSRPSRREIFGIHRLDRCRLLPDTGFARSACFRDFAPGDLDAYPGFSPPMGPAQADRTLDDPDLALRLGHRGACLFDALQIVSSGNVTQATCLQGCNEWRSPVRRWGDLEITSLDDPDNPVCITPSLALGDYLMFDHTVRSSARVRKLW